MDLGALQGFLASQRLATLIAWLKFHIPDLQDDYISGCSSNCFKFVNFTPVYDTAMIIISSVNN